MDFKQKRVLAKDIRQDAKSKGAVELTLFNAGTYVLSASEINEYVKDNKFVLTFFIRMRTQTLIRSLQLSS